MVQKINFFVVIIACCFFLGNQSSLFAQSTGEITGKITEKGSDVPIDFATVVFENAQGMKYAETDSLGNYTIKPITAGSYTMKVHRVGYQELSMLGVEVRTNKTTRADAELDFALLFNGEDIPVVTADQIWETPLIDVENIQTGTEITSKELRVAPISTPSEYIATTAGVIQGANGDIQMRGARAGTTAYYLEGMRVESINGLPMTSIEHIEVITGGIPAKYGDTTGGVVVITLK